MSNKALLSLGFIIGAATGSAAVSAAADHGSGFA